MSALNPGLSDGGWLDGRVSWQLTVVKLACLQRGTALRLGIGVTHSSPSGVLWSCILSGFRLTIWAPGSLKEQPGPQSRPDADPAQSTAIPRRLPDKAWRVPQSFVLGYTGGAPCKLLAQHSLARACRDQVPQREGGCCGLAAGPTARPLRQCCSSAVSELSMHSLVAVGQRVGVLITGRGLG